MLFLKNKYFRVVISRRLIFTSSVTLILSVLALLIIPYSSLILTKHLAKPPQLEKVREIIKGRTNIGMETTKSFITIAIENGFEDVFETLSQSHWEQLQREGLAIFLFQDDELKFWSENLDVSTVPELSDRLVRVQNAWCISYWIASDNVKGLMLVKVRYSYPFQNQFLSNHYHPSLKLLEGYSISPTSFNGSFPISLYSSAPVFYLTHIPKNFDKQIENITSILARASLLLLLISIYLVFWIPSVRKYGLISSLVLIIVTFSIRILTLHWHIIPSGSWRLFAPEVFAFSWITPSLGDLLINSLIVLAIACYTFRVLKDFKFVSKQFNLFLGLFLWSLSIVLLLITDNLFSVLVLNSTVALEAYRINSLSVFSLIEYLIISIWFVVAILSIISSLRFVNYYGTKKLPILLALFFLVALVLFWIFVSTPSLFGAIFIVLVAMYLGVYYKTSQLLKSSIFTLLILIFSIYSVIVVTLNAEKKDREVRKILAINMANERDPIAEVMFAQFARKMHADEDIINYLDNIASMEQDLYEHLNEYYITGYFKKYDFQITVCLPISDLFIEKSGQVIRCYSFFEDMLNEYGVRIPGTSFYHLNNQNGRISYLGMIEYLLPDGEEICIYLELDSKLSRELLGYPELLLDASVASRAAVADYSSAKYFHNQLIARTGSFNYPLVNHFEVDSSSRYTFITLDGQNHMIYNADGDVLVVLTKPTVGLFNITASFAWVFLFFFVIMLFLLWLGGNPVDLNIKVPSFKNRIRFSMIQVLLLSLILVAMVTITYSVKSFERKNFDNLNEKLVSAMVDIEGNLVREGLLEPTYSNYITHYLVRLSNVFHSDINLYDTQGNLLSTSRPEVFDRQLIGSKMHPIAWFHMDQRHSAKLIHTEQIGNMSFLSAYAPLFDIYNNKVAYINLPYFTRQGEFMDEVFAIIVALVNIYALLILVTIFAAVLISNQISRPLELIRHRISTIDIGKHNETIDYAGKDEVGKLVNEYNRMVFELAESAQKLAQSQRQSAWREMAKQIAHEIKNPLTPIKLNLQHLVRAKNDNMPGWEELFDKFADSLADQIKSLSNIATEFSNFAKMPVGHFENISLRKVIVDSVNLFSGYPNIVVESNFESEDNFNVFADREQLQRVFVNLLKNAVQAIGKKEGGRVVVQVKMIENHVRIVVEDNGVGISPEQQAKMFSPNFTTKSGGMGLGLAISRGIVETMGGKIWFKTEFGFGTRFYVDLPLSMSERK